MCSHGIACSFGICITLQLHLVPLGDKEAASASLPDTDLVITKPDPADGQKRAAEKLIWSFLVLFENLVGARTLLKSTQEAGLLVHPAPTQPALAKGTETQAAEEFVKKLQVWHSITHSCAG